MSDKDKDEDKIKEIIKILDECFKLLPIEPHRLAKYTEKDAERHRDHGKEY